VAVWGIVVGAGRGDRFGRPKQFCMLGSARVIDHAVTLMTAVCDGVVVVLPAGVTWDGAPVAAAVMGGDSRSDSVRAGLRAVPDEAEVVLVHDAARPLATLALCDAVIDAVTRGADAAIPALPVTDTLKRVDGTCVVDTVDRAHLVAVQTPQAFRASALRAAHASAAHLEVTDDAAVVEATGGRAVIVPADPRNVKITTPVDLVIAAALLEHS
jgi:2-C-methyl-D-erythritol 4-phosphate cytidylyltransferase